MINSIFPFMIVMFSNMVVSNTGKNHVSKKSEPSPNWQLQYATRQNHGY
jgi:hypothetical protein